MIGCCIKAFFCVIKREALKTFFVTKLVPLIRSTAKIRSQKVEREIYIIN